MPEHLKVSYFFLNYLFAHTSKGYLLKGYQIRLQHRLCYIVKSQTLVWSHSGQNHFLIWWILSINSSKFKFKKNELFEIYGAILCNDKWAIEWTFLYFAMLLRILKWFQIVKILIWKFCQFCDEKRSSYYLLFNHFVLWYVHKFV